MPGIFFAVMLTTPGPDPDGALAMALLQLGICLIVLLPFYILDSLALFRISRRRGISHAWLSWVPVGSNWILGSISDQYQQIAFGRTKKRRLILLLSAVLNVVLYVLTMVLLFAGIYHMSQLPDSTQPFSPEVLGAFAGAIGVALAALAGSVVWSVFNWMATYDLFRSCEPKNAVLFLVISLAINFVMPSMEIVKYILVLVVSKKDEGMVVPMQVRPVYDVPQWQPEEPPVEPWEQNDKQ